MQLNSNSYPGRRAATVIFWLATLLAVAPAAAALAPHEQRVAELKAIISDSAVIDRFGVSRPIEKIEWIMSEHYRVSGGGCYLDIAIRDVSGTTPMPGARRFVLVPSILICK